MSAITGTPNTLFDLLNKYRVIIPGIQRHYVQGDDTVKAKDVRTTFIRDIFSHIKTSEPLSLDFIYGPIDTSETDAFIPIDGQQRLTTLWLLARYFADFLNSSDRRAVLGILNRFSYEGRIHSSRFCEAFTSEGSSFVTTERRPPSDAIRHSAWFNPFWMKDKTVAGMLNTLDAIYDTHSQEDYKILTSTTCLDYMCRLLTFRLCVKAFADDTYMKMNARGLRLTQWENFKGRFSERLKNPDENLNWDRRIEALSDAYYDASDSGLQNNTLALPDNAFFALMARILVYEAKLLPSEKGHPTNIFKLSKHTEWTKELPYVPFNEFKLLLDQLLLGQQELNPADIAKTFLAAIAYITGTEQCANLLTPYWQTERTLIQSFCQPKNKNELDFSLCIYEYFKKFPAPKKDDFTRALRLMWNILKNVNVDDKNNPQNRIVGILKIIDQSDPSLYPEEINASDNSAPQYAEEAAKAAVYATGTTDEVKLMQAVEEHMHGRIRLGIFDLNGNNKPAFDHESLYALKQLFELYKTSENREHIIRIVIAAESVSPINEIPLRTGDDNLRVLLTTADDKFLHKPLLRFLKNVDYQNIMAINPWDVLKDNTSQPDNTDTSWWKRDLRKTILQFTSAENSTSEDSTKMNFWGRTVKWHHTDHYYLFSGTNITNALPISDYRIELLDHESYRKLERDIDHNPSVEMNDQYTRSGRYKKSDLWIYFYPNHIEVRKRNEQAKRFDRAISIPSNGHPMSPAEMLTELQRILESNEF